MTTVHHFGEDIVSMQQVENDIRAPFFSSPAYAFKNAGFPTHHIGPISFYDWQPITSLVWPHSNNTVWDRMKRLYRSDFNIAYNDWQEMLLTAIILIGFIVAIIVYFSTKDIDVSQVYTFKNPEDAKDPVKQAKLDNANKNIDTWNIVKMVLAIIPGAVTAWRLFKKSTYPIKTRRAAAHARQDASWDLAK